MRIWSLFLNEFKRLFQEKGTILILLLMPLGFILPVGMAYGSIEDDSGEVGDLLLVIDYDGGVQAADLIEKLDENFIIERNLSGDLVERVGLSDDPDCTQPGPACDEKVARAQLKNSSRAVALMIPSGMSAAYHEGEQSTVTLLYDPAGDVSFVQQVEGVIKGATISISLEKQVMQGKQDMSDLSAIGSDEVQRTVQDAASKEDDADTESAIVYEKASPTNFMERKPPNILQQNVPGYTVMFVFLVSGFMGGWIVEEKQNGILRRLLSAPVNAATLLGGKLLYGLVLALIQILVLFVVSSLLFKLSLGSDLLAFALVSIALSITVTSLGLLAAAVSFPGSAITAPLVIFALLGGCLFSRDFLPPFLRFVSNFIPHSWAMTAYQDLLLRGYTLPQVLPEIGALLGFAVVFFVVAVWRFDPLD